MGRTRNTPLLLLKIARAVVITVGSLFCFLLGCPIVGILTLSKLAQWHGWKLSAAGPTECLFLGVDIGERLYVYTIPFIGSLLTPMALVFAFWDVLALWMPTVLAVQIGIWKLKADADGISSRPARTDEYL